MVDSTPNIASTMRKGEPIPYVMCGTYTKEELKILKHKLIMEAFYD